MRSPVLALTLLLSFPVLGLISAPAAADDCVEVNTATFGSEEPRLILNAGRQIAVGARTSQASAVVIVTPASCGIGVVPIGDSLGTQAGASRPPTPA